ncbi:hypothetical protein [Clostridium sp. LS]|nr:hypothetical protein [Clostridium sp. LS]
MSLLYLVGRVIPESLFFVWAFYALSQTKMKIKRYLLSAIIGVVVICGVKLLPIDFGVHTLISMTGYIITNVLINKISIVKSIIVTLGVTIIEFICEIMDLFIIQNILHGNTEYIFSDSKLKILYGAPSFIFFILFVFVLRFLINKVRNNSRFEF